MFTKKSIISGIILLAMILSPIGSMVQSLAVEPPETLQPEEPTVDVYVENIDPDVETVYSFYEPDADVPGEQDDSAVFSAAVDPVAAFVERLYDLVLQRPPEAYEVQDWVTLLRTGRTNGAGIAYGFFFSKEMNDRNLSNQRYIEILYLTLLNRTFDQPGMDGWLTMANNGLPREDLFAGFVNSNEFSNLCAAAGIIRGTYIPPAGGQIKIFVTRMYRETIQREPVQKELDDWTALILAGQTGVSVAYGFVFSNEMINIRKPDNGQFVDILYRAFLGRGPDAPGRAFWVERLDNGFPREDVFAGFANSVEFAGICAAAGIVRGTYFPPPGGEIRAFVTHMFRLTTHAGPRAGQLTQADVDFWYEALRTGRVSAATFAHGLFFNDIMSERFSYWYNISYGYDFVDVMYRALLSRAPIQADRDYWNELFDNGVSRYSIFTGVINSDEFNRICINLNITRGTVPAPTNYLPTDDWYPLRGRVWNMFRAANFSGISDRPEHIAGIIGNLQAENYNFCPFRQQPDNTRAGLGILQWQGDRRNALVNYMWSNGISQVQFVSEMNRHTDGNCYCWQIPDFRDRVLEVQVNFLLHELRTSENHYLEYLNSPSNRTGYPGARAYAELFCVMVVRPGVGIGAINNVVDPGVREALQMSPFVGGPGELNRVSFSMLDARREYSANTFWRYLDIHH